MRTNWRVLVTGLLLITALPEVSESSSGELSKHVDALTQPGNAGRAPGSPGLEAAADYIESEFAALALAPGNDGDWSQRFPLTAAPTDEVHLAPGKKWNEVELENLIGVVEGTGEGRQSVLVVAHYDHLGTADDGTVYVGADDNASGVAVLLETARALVAEGPLHHDLIFIAFSGEEAGLAGSRHYVAHPTVPLGSVRAVINLDAIGRMQDRRIYALGAGTALEFEEALKGINLGFGFDLAMPQSGPFASDHVPFVENGVPALHFTTGANPDYHRPTDTSEKLNYEGLVETVDFVTELAGFLADDPDPLHFVPPGAARVEPATAEAGAKPRRVSLGTIPDFGRESGGVLLSGVMPDSPAAKAGFLKGDILVSLAGTPVDNLSDFSAVLKAHQPGDVVEVEVLRNGESVKAEVTLAERKSR